LGIDSRRLTWLAFVISGFLTGIGGLMLAGQVGIGSPSTGTDYTLMSITVVVLGGASVAGGRGSFISTFFGAALVQATSSASSFIDANSSVHYAVIGTLTLLAAIFFSVARRRAANAELLLPRRRFSLFDHVSYRSRRGVRPSLRESVAVKCC
jgi:ribose transport system ATP-binding protein